MPWSLLKASQPFKLSSKLQWAYQLSCCTAQRIGHKLLASTPLGGRQRSPQLLYQRLNLQEAQCRGAAQAEACTAWGLRCLPCMCCLAGVNRVDACLACRLQLGRQCVPAAGSHAAAGWAQPHTLAAVLAAAWPQHLQAH